MGLLFTGTRMDACPPETVASKPSPRVDSGVAAAVDRLAGRFASELDVAMAEGKIAWPSMPDVLLRIRAVMASSSANGQRIADAVSTDPTLAARFIRMANSVYYSNGTACDSLRDAVVRLGNDAVEEVANLLVVARVFAVGQRRRLRPHLRMLCTHSTRVAAISEVLADGQRELRPETAILAGLIHDIGVLPVIVHATRYPAILDKPSVLEPLVMRLHTRLGPSVLAEWNFTRQLVQVITGHEDLNRKGDPKPDYVDLVIVANRLSHLDDGDPQQGEQVCALPAARKLGLGIEDVDDVLSRARERHDQLQGLLTQP